MPEHILKELATKSSTVTPWWWGEWGWLGWSYCSYTVSGVACLRARVCVLAWRTAWMRRGSHSWSHFCAGLKTLVKYRTTRNYKDGNFLVSQTRDVGNHFDRTRAHLSNP